MEVCVCDFFILYNIISFRQVVFCCLPILFIMIYDTYLSLIKQYGKVYAYCWLAMLLDVWYIEDKEAINAFKFKV